MSNLADHAEHYPMSQVAAAIGVSASTLANWLKPERGFVIAGDKAPDKGSPLHNPGTGRTRYFSLHRAKHIALTGELIRVGLDISTASTLALEFSDMGGEDSGGIVGDSPAVKGRNPGAFYPTGETVFRVRFFADQPPKADVARWEDIRESPLVDIGPRSASVLIVDLETLIARLIARLK